MLVLVLLPAGRLLHRLVSHHCVYQALQVLVLLLLKLLDERVRILDLPRQPGDPSFVHVHPVRFHLLLEQIGCVDLANERELS